MKRGKDVRDPGSKVIGGESTNEVQVLSFAMVEKAPGTGAFILRSVSNEDLLADLRKQGVLGTFLTNLDGLYAEFKRRFEQ